MATTPEPTDQFPMGIASDSRQLVKVLVIWMIGFIDSPIELQLASCYALSVQSLVQSADLKMPEVHVYSNRREWPRDLS